MIRKTLVPADIAQSRAQFATLTGATFDDAFLLVLKKRIEAGSVAYHCVSRRDTCVVGDFFDRERNYRIVTLASTYMQGDVWRMTASGWEQIGSLREFGCTEDVSHPAGRRDRFTPFASEFFVLSNGDCIYQVAPDLRAMGSALAADRGRAVRALLMNSCGRGCSMKSVR